jgi:hypothetical protein
VRKLALKQRVTLKNDLQVDNAYIRIDTVSGSKDSLNISVNSYVSHDAFIDGKSYLEQNFYTFTPSVDDGAPNYHKQGYLYLKTLSEFQNAVDLID